MVPVSLCAGIIAGPAELMYSCAETEHRLKGIVGCGDGKSERVFEDMGVPRKWLVLARLGPVRPFFACHSH
jgi:hypothetical protein